MAVLRLGALSAHAPDAAMPFRALHHAVVRPAGRIRRIATIFTAPLPQDVRDCECSVVLLFRASQALNCLTGGRDEMTFSARCHILGRRARSRGGRTAWRLTEGIIDASCGILRGECAHCATAWSNYRARGRRTGAVDGR